MSATNVRFVSPLDLLIYLRSVMQIGGMSRSALVGLASEASERFVPEGALLLDPDLPVENVYILVEGRIEIDTGEYTEVIEPPSGLNWLRLHGGFETNHKARALVDSLVLEINASKMVEQLERNAGMLEGVLRQYARFILQLRDDLPVHPDQAPPALPGEPPAQKMGLIERLNMVARPGGYWGHANLDAVMTLVRDMHEIHFERGDVLWELGDQSPHTWTIVSGMVECTSGSGQSVEVGAGFGLGFYDALGEVPRSFRAVATHDGVALRASINEMLAVMEHQTTMAFTLLSRVARDFSREHDADQIRKQNEAQDALSAAGE